MPVALNTISTAQALATTTTMGDIVWLLNYAETHPDSTLHYCSINMILHVTSYASYLCEECAHSQDGCHFFFADQLVKMVTNILSSPPTMELSTPCYS